TLVDLLNVPRISNPQLSPDGRDVVYVQAQADWKANKRISHLWRVAVAGGQAVQLTTGAEGETTPRWSPDGKTIAFVAKRNGDDSMLDYELSHDGRRVAVQRAPSPKFGDGDQGEVWVMDADGTHALQLTKNTVPESGPMLSPDNSRVLFLSQANPQFEIYYN